ncbi:MAG: phosphoribosyltransferase family protein [Patescibacteria group bacterium]|jgi:orotate phosphoribosyltransferase
MNIHNQELIKRLGTFPNLFTLVPVMTSYGLIPVDFTRGVVGEPMILRLLAEEFKRLIDFSQVDIIAGIELSGVTMAAAISMATGKPMVIVRGKSKRAGRPVIVGDMDFIKPGTRVLLVDDSMAAAKSKRESAKKLAEVGAIVTGVAVFIYGEYQIDRFHEKYQDVFDSQLWFDHSGIRLYHLITWKELTDLQLKYGTMDKELNAIARESLHWDTWEDDEEGYITRMVQCFKQRKLLIPDYVLEYYKSKGIDLAML